MMERTDSSSAMMLLQYGGDDSDEESSFNEQDHPTSAAEKKIPEERRRHSSGKGSDPLSPSRRISEDSVGRQSAGLISDEELEHHLPERFRKRDHGDREDEEGLTTVPPKMFMMDVSKKMAPAVSPGDNNSNSSFPGSQHSNSKDQKKASKPYPMRLVSYGADDLEEDDDEDDSHDESEEEDKDVREEEEVVQGDGGASPNPKGLNMVMDNIQLPPEPPGKCSKQLQDKISHLYTKMQDKGFDTNKEIQSLTSFRNPSIYEKLIQTYHIDERGSNFSLDIYNPHMWGKDSLYDELDKVQKKDMERREKDRKTKIEFISGTKKSAPAYDNSSSAAADDKKRKSKWDALPSGLPQMQRGGFGSAPANLTSAATGTRATVISAVGTLTKKAPYNVITTSTSGPANR